jgi:hypothetical protein
LVSHSREATASWEPFQFREIVELVAVPRLEENNMKRTLLIGAAALAAALITTIPASAMLGVAPASALAVQDDAVIQV